MTRKINKQIEFLFPFLEQIKTLNLFLIEGKDKIINFHHIYKILS